MDKTAAADSAFCRRHRSEIEERGLLLESEERASSTGSGNRDCDEWTIGAEEAEEEEEEEVGGKPVVNALVAGCADGGPDEGVWPLADAPVARCVDGGCIRA